MRVAMAAISETLEVRWFFGEADPSVRMLEAFFRDVASESTRRDVYLPTGCDDLGVKARVTDGQPTKVEAKHRLGRLGAVYVTAGLPGVIERWQKISFDASEPAFRVPGAIEVTKDRRARTYALGHGDVTPAARESRVDAGCAVELTRLEARPGERDVRAWTLGLEAFGPQPRLLEALLSTARHVFARELASLTLAASASKGYPAWLAEQAALTRA